MYRDGRILDSGNICIRYSFQCCFGKSRSQEPVEESLGIACVQRFFFFQICHIGGLMMRWVGHHPQEDFTKFHFRLVRKVEKFRNCVHMISLSFAFLHEDPKLEGGFRR
jgi:hypothetical protein